MSDSVDFVQHEAARLARRLGASNKAILLIDPETERTISVIVANHTFQMLQYLSGPQGSRSAYNRLNEALQAGRTTVRVSKPLRDALKAPYGDLAKKDQLPRLYLRGSGGKVKAVMVSWTEFALLTHSIGIHARKNRIDEVRRNVAAAFDGAREFQFESIKA